jgi:hypothetical protein
MSEMFYARLSPMMSRFLLKRCFEIIAGYFLEEMHDRESA